MTLDLGASLPPILSRGRIHIHEYRRSRIDTSVKPHKQTKDTHRQTGREGDKQTHKQRRNSKRLTIGRVGKYRQWRNQKQKEIELVYKGRRKHTGKQKKIQNTHGRIERKNVNGRVKMQNVGSKTNKRQKQSGFGGGKRQTNGGRINTKTAYRGTQVKCTKEREVER